jgi:hypothetical protein
LTNDEQDELIRDIMQFFNFAKVVAPDLINLPKMHFLVSHFPQFVKQHGFIGLMSEQGTEAIHSIVNTDTEKWKSMAQQRKWKEVLNQSIYRNYIFDLGKN